MGSFSSFGQAVQEILLNNYLKNNFENSEIKGFVSFFEFRKGKILLKNTPLFRNLNANISGTAHARKINGPILKSSS